MAEYQSQPELNKEKIKEIAREYWDKYSALEKSEKEESQKSEERQKLFEEFYEKCKKNDEILGAVGVEMVDLYKAGNTKEEGEATDEKLDSEFHKKNHNFIHNFPHGQKRLSWTPGGNLFRVWEQSGEASKLGFVRGSLFFDTILRIALWSDLDKFLEKQKVNVAKLRETIKKAGLTSDTYDNQELLDLRLKDAYKYLRRAGYTERILKA